MGYLGDPEKTKEAFDEAGWLHTGDLGRFNDKSFLQLAGRKKVSVYYYPNFKNNEP